MPQTDIGRIDEEWFVFSWTTGARKAICSRSFRFDIRDEQQVLAQCRWLENAGKHDLADDLLERHLTAVAST